MESTLNNAATLIQSRIDDLDAEREQLVTAIEALTGTEVTTPKAPRKAPKAKVTTAKKGTKSKSTKKSTKSQGPRKNDRTERVIEAIRQNPGTTVAELAKSFKMAPNYLYRVTNKLVAAGTVVKDGKSLNVVA